MIEFIFQNAELIFLNCVILNLAVFAIAYFVNPKINRKDIIYQERWQFGKSFNSTLTRLLGQNFYLHILFLKDRLIIKPHYPLDPFMYQWLGIEKMIPYDSIIKFESRKAFIFKTGIILIFRNEEGAQEKILFTTGNPQKVKEFLLFPASKGKIFDQEIAQGTFSTHFPIWIGIVSFLSTAVIGLGIILFILQYLFGWNVGL